MDYYDSQETQDQKAREATLREALPVQIAHAKERSPYYRDVLADVDPENIDTRAALAALPITRKADLQALQQQNMPFGGLATIDAGRMTRIYQSPGPIYEPEARRGDYWRMARALYAAGFRSGQVVHNTFSYHFTPAGFMLETGARALNCAVFPAGTGQTELQVKAIADLKPDGYVGTPSFLKILLDKADELDLDVGSVKRALVSGEALPPSLREDFSARGVSVYQCYATADLGLIAFESSALEGLIVDEGVIVEIVRPGSGDPVTADDEVGEVVVTTFNPEYPLIRFATGDLSAVLPGHSPCGRTNLRIKGWLGRADQTTKVRGMFVHPSQVIDVIKRHDAVLKGRLVVASEDHQDVMTLQCEVGAGSDELAAAIAATIRDVCKLRGEVEFVPPDSLVNDGKVIDDVRTYE